MRYQLHLACLPTLSPPSTPRVHSLPACSSLVEVSSATAAAPSSSTTHCDNRSLLCLRCDAAWAPATADLPGEAPPTDTLLQSSCTQEHSSSRVMTKVTGLVVCGAWRATPGTQEAELLADETPPKRARVCQPTPYSRCLVLLAAADSMACAW